MSDRRRPLASELSVSMVLGTSELLESILLHLDMRCLLTSALRVCRHWRDLIQGSLSLRRALFFECEDKPNESYGAMFNPLLVELFPLLFNFAGTPSYRGFNDLAVEALPIGSRKDAFYRRNASWRRMHLRQPLVKHVGLWTLDKTRSRKENMRMVKYDGGLRMEGFYFLVLKHVYWWDLFVKWGEMQGRQLRHFKHVRSHMIGKAEEMVCTADVTIAGLGDDYCIDEGKTRRSAEGSGLMKMAMGRLVADNDGTNEDNAEESAAIDSLDSLGIFWFKVMERDGWEVLWEKEDGPFCCRRHCDIERLPYAPPL